jgi:hypothetical protein
LDWKSRIVTLVQIKQLMADLDEKGLWQYKLPGVAATEEGLRAVEMQLGEPLDSRYRDFLRCADGWPAFHQTVDLFGHRDLLGSMAFRHAMQMLDAIEEEVLVASRLRREDLLPIAATPVDLDLFVITRASAPQPGLVMWFAGYEIDRFPSFDEYFLAMMDYNRLEVKALQQAAPKGRS